MKFQYYNPVDVYFGENCIREHANIFQRYGSHALIVTGRSSRKNGSFDDVVFVLEDLGIPYHVYDQVMPNPTVVSVRDGAAYLNSCGADFIIGIGGGSPMDTAKGIALLARQDLSDEGLFVASRYTDDVVPMIMVPTTAGTGSEVSKYSVLMNEALHTKSSIASEVIYPKAAFLDYRYTRGVGHDTTLYPALDGLSHAIEGILSTRNDPMIVALALESIRTIGSCLPALEKMPLTGDVGLSDEIREKLLYGTYLGGLVLAHTSTTVVHAIGHSLTFSKGIVHGRANALVLPGYVQFTEKHDPAIVSRILEALGMASTEEFRTVMDRLLGEKETLTEDEIQEFTSTVMKKKNIPQCHIVPTAADVETMLRGI